MTFDELRTVLHNQATAFEDAKLRLSIAQALHQQAKQNRVGLTGAALEQAEQDYQATKQQEAEVYTTYKALRITVNRARGNALRAYLTDPSATTFTVQ